jgi:branched-chain amino acid transport system ATP-binding protein
MNALLEVDGVSVSYGHVRVLEDVSITVPTSSIVGLIGHNGAGKSTLMAAIAGVVPADHGTIHLAGVHMVHAGRRSLARDGVSYVPQGRGVFAALTVRENLALGLRAGTGIRLQSPEGQAALEAVLESIPLLVDLLERPAGQLSGGQQGLVSIGRGLIVRPRLLLLDEPSTGLAPVMVNEVLKVVRRLKESQDTSVVLVEQNIPQVLDLADHLFVLKAGRLVASGPPAEFRESQAVMELL